MDSSTSTLRESVTSAGCFYTDGLSSYYLSCIPRTLQMSLTYLDGTKQLYWVYFPLINLLAPWRKRWCNWPSWSCGLALQTQPTTDKKYSGKKLTLYWIHTDFFLSLLHKHYSISTVCITVVVGFLSNLEIVQSVKEVMHSLDTNVNFYTKDLSIHGFYSPQKVLDPISWDAEGQLYFVHVCYKSSDNS